VACRGDVSQPRTAGRHRRRPCPRTVSAVDAAGELLARAIEQVVATATRVDVRVVAEPQALPGGFASQLYTFRIEDPPTGWTGELVLRIPPRDRDVCREGEIQREVVD
jgi:hypothetical protein